MFASAMCVREGAVAQAAFEIVRQLWVLAIQLFEALNIAGRHLRDALRGGAREGRDAVAHTVVGRAFLALLKTFGSLLELTQQALP